MNAASFLVRICADAIPDEGCSGASGDEFAPAYALSSSAWVAVCRDADILNCQRGVGAVYKPLSQLVSGDFVFGMDEAQGFGALMLVADLPAAGAAIGVHPPFRAHGALTVSLAVLVLAFGFLVVSTWQRVRAFDRSKLLPVSAHRARR